MSGSQAMPDSVTDAQGRVLKLHVMDPMDMLDLYEAAGDVAGNATWVRYAMILASVTQIDDLPIPAPKTKDQIRALGKRLGNDGLVAVAKVMFPDPPATEDGAAPKDGDVVAAAKN